MGNMDVAMESVTRRDRGNPPYVTRGLDSQVPQIVSGSVGIHWLRGSIEKKYQEWLIDRMAMLFGSEIESHEYGFWRYDRHIKWPCGAMVLWHSTEQGSALMNGRIALEIPGRALETLDSYDIGMTCVSLWKRGFHATRIDVFYDDMDRVITPSRLYQMIYEPGLFADDPIKEDFTGFLNIRNLSEGHKGRGLVHDEIAFGKRGNMGGQKYLRIYDKRLESDGENPAIRWELELCDHKANGLFKELVHAFGSGAEPGVIVEVMGRWIGGCVDFKMRTDRVGDKNLCRLERYHFWQLILDKLGWARLVGKRVVKTVEKACEWFCRQVVGNLQMMVKAYGPGDVLPFLVDLATGENRLRPSHLKALAEFHRQYNVGTDSFKASALRIASKFP